MVKDYLNIHLLLIVGRGLCWWLAIRAELKMWSTMVTSFSHHLISHLGRQLVTQVIHFRVALKVSTLRGTTIPPFWVQTYALSTRHMSCPTQPSEPALALTCEQICVGSARGPDASIKKSRGFSNQSIREPSEVAPLPNHLEALEVALKHCRISKGKKNLGWPFRALVTSHLGSQLLNGR